MVYKEAAAPVFPMKSTLNSKHKDIDPGNLNMIANIVYMVSPPPKKRKLIAKI